MNAWNEMYHETLRFGARLILFLLFLSFLGMIGVAFAQSNTFPIGVPIVTQALFCFDKESAQVIVDKGGDYESAEVRALMLTGKCVMGRGQAIYVREVYRKGRWAVWELNAGNTPPFYEATDWKGVTPGTVGA